MTSGSSRKYPKRYIDANDVERGYYVYAHLCKRTQKIFYVGKGHSGRAWSTNRADNWHDFVKALPDGYEVKLLHEDLTEVDSFYHESQEIAANGGAAAVGGTLLNWFPQDTMDGDLGPSATIELQWEQTEEDKEQWAAFYAVRAFVPLTPQERVVAAESFGDVVVPTYSELERLRIGYLDKNREPPSGLESACFINSELSTLASRLRNKKLSYAEFCESSVDQIEQLHTNVEDISKRSKYRKLIGDNVESVDRWFSQFEIPGNKEAAEKAMDVVYRRQFKSKHGVDPYTDQGFQIMRDHAKKAIEALRRGGAKAVPCESPSETDSQDH